MSCQENRSSLHAYLDGELDFINAAKFEAHLRECADCALTYRNFQTLRSGLRSPELYFNAPVGMANRVRSQLGTVEQGATRGRASPGREARRLFWNNPLAVAALAAAVTFLVTFAALRRGPRTSTSQRQILAQEVLDSHIRSLMGDHLMDVQSSDQHTVKPWFDGKVNFSPPVPDFSKEGFPLIGGRLDYLGNRPVAALVYRRRKHIINLFIWPGHHESGERTRTRQGYHLISWSHGNMNYWAVSDVNPAELNQFIRLVRQSESALP